MKDITDEFDDVNVMLGHTSTQGYTAHLVVVEQAVVVRAKLFVILVELVIYADAFA
ncbi:MAG: hypothetical protein IKN15_05550 [Bacteroidaceae bacterium]|nr:hypothetical protein [Bacteroidaceae bacterium]